MEGPLSPGATNGALRAPSPTPPAIDPQLIVEHLERILGVNLGASERDLSAPGSLLSESKRPDTLQRCARFALEGQSVLYVTKEQVTEPPTNDLEATNGERLATGEKCTV
jgi:dynein heavy chain 1